MKENILKYYISEKVIKYYLSKRKEEIKNEIGENWANPYESGQLNIINEILNLIHDTHVTE